MAISLISVICASYLFKGQNREFEEFLHTSLEWIIRAGQDVGIR